MQLGRSVKFIQSCRVNAYLHLRELIRNVKTNRAINPFAEALLSRLVLLTPETAIVGGARMYLAKDRISLQMALSKTWEPRNSALVQEHVRRGDTVVDVGAHIGYFTLLFSRLVGKDGRVYAFEPNPGNYQLLKMNIEANECRNVIIEQKAVSDRTGTSRLKYGMICGANAGSDSCISDDSLPVETVSLDEYFGDEKVQISFLKMDIEGHELSALRGAARTIERSESMKILTEFDPFRWLKVGVNPKEFLELLARVGFEVSIIDSTRAELQLVTNHDLMVRRYNQMGKNLDLFCVRASKR